MCGARLVMDTLAQAGQIFRGLSVPRQRIQEGRVRSDFVQCWIPFGRYIRLCPGATGCGLRMAPTASQSLDTEKRDGLSLLVFADKLHGRNRIFFVPFPDL